MKSFAAPLAAQGYEVSRQQKRGKTKLQKFEKKKKSYQVTLMKFNLVRRLLTGAHLEAKGDDLVAKVFT